jgi:hypothetical protein
LVYLVGTEKQEEIRELFGRVLRFHCWQRLRFPNEWKTLRDLVRDFERWGVRGVLAPILLGTDRSRLLADWLDRARWAAKPDCTPEDMEEILEEIEVTSARPLPLRDLLQELAELVGTKYPPFLFDPIAGELSLFDYYPTILFQERIEDALSSTLSNHAA